MHKYNISTPNWLKKLFTQNVIWDMPNDSEPSVYITFDDGPHPEITPFVLQQLEVYNAKATFFCVGNNVEKNLNVYNSIISKGHAVGNHTFDHLKGWKTDNHTYIKNIEKASQYIKSNLFRPPYGKIKLSQKRELLNRNSNIKIIMWSVLSADFDTNISPKKCLNNVISNIKPGSIVIFHDSEKALERMSFALPEVLKFCKEKKWKMKAIY